MTDVAAVEKKICELLKEYTSAKQLHRTALLYRLRDAGITLSDSRMRTICKEMVIEGHYNIGSSRDGYFFCHTEEDVRVAEKSYDEKSAAIAVRKNCVRRNFEEHMRTLNPQEDLFGGMQ